MDGVASNLLKRSQFSVNFQSTLFSTPTLLSTTYLYTLSVSCAPDRTLLIKQLYKTADYGITVEHSITNTTINDQVAIVHVGLRTLYRIMKLHIKSFHEDYLNKKICNQN